MQRPQSCGRAIGRNRESFVARQDQNATHGRRAIRAPRKTRARQLETKINIVSQSAVMPNEKKTVKTKTSIHFGLETDWGRHCGLRIEVAGPNISGR